MRPGARRDLPSLFCSFSFFLLPCLLLSQGCTQMLRPEQATLGEQAEEGDFLHDHLPRQPVVTVAEAYRAMLLLADGEDHAASFSEREESLLARKIVRSAWKLERDAAIDRGSVGYMVARILQIRGGVNREILGGLGIGDRRYAVRELMYLDIMPSGATYRYISGAELVDVMGRADKYMAEHKLYDLPSERIDEMLKTGRPTTQAALLD